MDAGLARRAAAEGISKAELIRRTLRDAALPIARPKLYGRGMIKGTPPDLASRVDDYLEGFGED